jgi:aspartate dehydrogenase
MTLSAIATRDHEKARRNMADFNRQPELVTLDQLGSHADIIIECAPKSVFAEIGNSAISRGKTFMPLSVGALLDNPELLRSAEENGALIFVPTGALLGLDAVKAVAEGDVTSISLVTRKPPNGLRGAPYLVDNQISVDNLQEAKQVFSGSARDAAKAFPANVNVAAALALAGIGPERTTVEVWADPAVNRNMHTISVDADASSFTMSIQNVPSETPATGKITALSVIAALRRFTATLVVGT